jgi:hypothetical protein
MVTQRWVSVVQSQTDLLVPGQFALYSYPTVQSFLFGLSINL